MTKLRQQRMVLYLQPHTSVPGTEPAGEINHKTKQMQCKQRSAISRATKKKLAQG